MTDAPTPLDRAAAAMAAAESVTRTRVSAGATCSSALATERRLPMP